MRIKNLLSVLLTSSVVLSPVYAGKGNLKESIKNLAARKLKKKTRGKGYEEKQEKAYEELFLQNQKELIIGGGEDTSKIKFQKFKNLELIKLKNSNISDAEVNRIQCLHNVKTLHIDNCQKLISYAWIKNFKNLKVVKFRNLKINDWLINSIPNLERVSSLTIDNCINVQLRASNFSKKFSSLEKLELCNYKRWPKELKALKLSTYDGCIVKDIFPNLKNLTLRSCSYFRAYIVRDLNKLEELNLENSTGTQKLYYFKNLPKSIIRLNLNGYGFNLPVIKGLKYRDAHYNFIENLEELTINLQKTNIEVFLRILQELDLCKLKKLNICCPESEKEKVIKCILLYKRRLGDKLTIKLNGVIITTRIMKIGNSYNIPKIKQPMPQNSSNVVLPHFNMILNYLNLQTNNNSVAVAPDKEDVVMIDKKEDSAVDEEDVVMQDKGEDEDYNMEG